LSGELTRPLRSPATTPEGQRFINPKLQKLLVHLLESAPSYFKIEMLITQT
jgi:hypothetical protein